MRNLIRIIAEDAHLLAVGRVDQVLNGLFHTGKRRYGHHRTKLFLSVNFHFFSDGINHRRIEKGLVDGRATFIHDLGTVSFGILHKIEEVSWFVGLGQWRNRNPFLPGHAKGQLVHSGGKTLEKYIGNVLVNQDDFNGRTTLSIEGQRA